MTTLLLIIAFVVGAGLGHTGRLHGVVAWAQAFVKRAATWARARGYRRRAPVGPAAVAVSAPVLFDPIAVRGTRSNRLEDQTAAWRDEMLRVGERLVEGKVRAVVFVHGTFTGTDPLSTMRVVAEPGRGLGRRLKEATRACVDRLLGDFGNFGAAYVELFEVATGGRVPCTNFVWSSENHHLGRLEGALGLVRALAAHAELAEPRGRLLVYGHSHAAQLFALVTQLMSGSVAATAIADVARVRGLDVGSLDVDIARLRRIELDFVTFGAPARYAWAALPRVRALHVLGARDGVEEDLVAHVAGQDWIQRLGTGASDLPALAIEERRLNAALDTAFGNGFSASHAASALFAPASSPRGEVVRVDYGGRSVGALVASGLGHGIYTRLDAMLFHARLVVTRLYPASVSFEGASVRGSRGTLA